MRCVGRVARMGQREIHKGFWWGNKKERYHSEDLELNGRVLLKLKFFVVRAWSIWPTYTAAYRLLVRPLSPRDF